MAKGTPSNDSVTGGSGVKNSGSLVLKGAPRGRGRPRKEQVWLEQGHYRRWFGMDANTFRRRGIKSQPDPDTKKALFNFDEVLEACGEIILASLERSVGSASDGSSLSDLKTMKLEEEVRKLRINNDQEEGSLVPVHQVAMSYAKGIRVICDKLDTLPSRVKMEHPEIAQSVLDSINQLLIEVRNSSAEFAEAEFQAELFGEDEALDEEAEDESS